MAQKINYSALSLAFFGDAVYELYVRERVLKTVTVHVDKLNKYTKKLSMAAAQAQIADLLVADGVLTEEELAVYKRGRNAKSASLPKSCSPVQYRKATGLESLMGYLFLKGEKERIAELIDYGTERLQ